MIEEVENPNKEQGSSEDLKISFEGNNRNEYITLSANEFLYAEANGNYAEICYLKEGAIHKKLLRSTLTQLEQQVEQIESIQRVHRKYLANLNGVNRVSGNAQGYKLHYGELVVPVSRKNAGVLL